MPSTWVERRETRGGQPRFIVRYRLGGRESIPRYGGSFRTLRDARVRARIITGELAALRVPNMKTLSQAAKRLTVAEVCQTWAESRIDAADATRTLHRVALSRVTSRIGQNAVEDLTPAAVGEFVGDMHRAGYARGTIQKSLTALRMALDHAGVEPNPARDRRVVLPREQRREIAPPTAAHVEAAISAVAPRYRLPLLVLEATAMRISELELLRWADVDENAGRWRVSQAVAKTRRPRWVQVPSDLFQAVLALVPREDRDPEAPVFPHVEQARLRTELGRACRATGTPRFGLHDLRHRRVSVWHREGIPVREVAERAGHARASVTLDVYSHVMVDDREIDRAALL
jgi:integrase